jgi:long-chain acyl-CoA synthetase
VWVLVLCPQAIYIESEPFSLANDLLTPTMKLKRQEARERYRSIIDELYAQVERTPRRSKL